MSGDRGQHRSPADRNSAAPARPSQAEASPQSDSATKNAAPDATQWTSWSNLWQIPTIVISAGLIAFGIFTTTRPVSTSDLDQTLIRIEAMITGGEYRQAAERLRIEVEPGLPTARSDQQARYHADVADLVHLSQANEGVSDKVNHRQILEHYGTAAKLGAALDAARLERWAEASLAMDDLPEARQRLKDIDALIDTLTPRGNDGEASPDEPRLARLRESRNRVFRRIVEASVRQPHVTPNEIASLLAEYRMKGHLKAADELWGVARQAQLRLESGLAQQAVDFLLVEMRRLESRGTLDASANLGELYGLLGRGYFELGDYDRAQRILERALEQFQSGEAAKGDALVLLGHILASRGEFDAALEKFQIVVRDFVSTGSYMPGLLGRAEMESVLGMHEESMVDYETLRKELARVGMRRDVTPRRVAESLNDRHDAALAMGKIDLAMRYATIAENLFPTDDVPADVLFRLASTNRQVAENLAGITDAPAESTDHSASPLPPDVRFEANQQFKKAGDYFLRHSAASAGPGAAQDAWADSLWMAADSYDRAGRQDLAIQQFVRYMDNRPFDDQRRGESLFRIGQAFQAQMQFDRAITYYEQVISDRARSTFAAQSYVPLARCYVAVNRRPEAVAQLHRVLSGDLLLQPDARDFRDAMIELGRIHYDADEHPEAIQALSGALQRYPDDPRKMDMQFLLADSYRGSAMQTDQTLRQEPMMSPTELGRLRALYSEHLQSAMDLFGSISDAYSPREVSLSPFDQDQLRRAKLYRADCAFYLGQYRNAIELYDQITRQYSSHYSSMYALIQIVNCYRVLGEDDRAQAAHRRALVRLKQLPDNAFDAPDALMDRTAWERWLENVPLAPPDSASAGANAG